MNDKIYEMVSVNRHSGLLEADTLRIGKRYIPMLIDEGACAVLVHEDDHNKSLVTSRVESVTALDDDKTIEFTTKHTTYTIRKVTDDYINSMSHEELIAEILLLRKSEIDLMRKLDGIQALLNGEESE